MRVKRYRKKPVEIEAMEFDGTSVTGSQIVDWITGSGNKARFVPRNDLDYWSRPQLVIETLEGTMWASPGDFIIRGVANEFYPCKPDIFWKTYEEAGVNDE